MQNQLLCFLFFLHRSRHFLVFFIFFYSLEQMQDFFVSMQSVTSDLFPLWNGLKTSVA